MSKLHKTNNSKNKKSVSPMEKFKKERIGLINTAKNGQKMTIIGYEGSRKVKIKFEDGTIVENKCFEEFKRGHIHNPNKPLPHKVPDTKAVAIKAAKTRLAKDLKERLGKKTTASNGQEMSIIAYRSAKDLDVQFEDGTIITNRTYNHFKLGTIKNPNFKPFVGTSVNETTLLYYFKEIGFSKKELRKDLEYGFYEYDLFNKNLMLAIEYDGDPRTHTKEKDERKNDDAEAHGITIWRVRTPDVPTCTDKRNVVFNLKNSWLFTKDFEEIIKSIINKINKAYKTSYELDIDLKRDKLDILSFLRTNYYLKTNDRIGETKIAGNGQKMTIIDYITNGNISVQFEDGVIVKNTRYSDFLLGNIANPTFSTRAFLHAKERVGEEKIANNGLKMKIIAYRNCHDIDVEFETGEIIYNASYNNFTRGGIGAKKVILDKKPIPKNKKVITKRKIEPKHIGESVIAKNGLKATIIDYKNYSDITVKFDDGITVKSSYDRFKEGCIKHPGINPLIKKEHIGEVKMANNGQEMAIIDYRSGMDIDVRFADGTIVKGRGYKEFKKGSIANPTTDTKNYLGKTFIANNGQKLTVIEYINSKNVTVQFEDGTIVKNRLMYNIIHGQVSNPNFSPEITKNSAKIIGETNISNAGFKMEITKYNSSKDITVKFEDGTIAEHCDYYAFKNGAIGKPISSRIGERNKNSKGEEFEIIEYKNSKDITIKFLDDGTILKHKYYNDFKNGHFRKPKIL